MSDLLAYGYYFVYVLAVLGVAVLLASFLSLIEQWWKRRRDRF